MVTPATLQKRQDLSYFIERELAPDPAVQGVIGIGSIASGLARPDSDIDAVVFLEPFDPYIVPAEFKWCPADGSFHSIFNPEIRPEDYLQFDFYRADLNEWAAPGFAWEEGWLAQLGTGWPAFDRQGRVAKLIAARTAYPDDLRIARLDEALTWLDQHLGEGDPEKRWQSLGPTIAHDRLQAACGYLVRALFAYNRRWQPWRNRRTAALLSLPWLPDRFDERVLPVLAAPGHDYAAFQTRVESLRGLFQDLMTQLTSDGDYGSDIIGEAFIRSHEEPGRAWNMAEWNERHRTRANEKRLQAQETDLKPTVDRFEMRIVVQPADIDQLGHVNNLVYLRWVQELAIAHWQAAASAADQERLLWVIARHEIDYKRPAHLGDEIRGQTWVGRASRRAFDRHTEFRRGSDQRLLARVRTVWCPIDRQTGQPTDVSPAVRAKFSQAQKS